MGMKLSASRIKKFSSCPLAYWFRYIEREEATKEDSDYVTMGSRVHEAIENTLNQVPPWDQDILKNLIQNEYVSLREYEIDDEDIYASGLDCCENAAKYLAKQEPKLQGIEERVKFNVKQLDAEFTAIMDVCTDEEIWDWKTGRIRDDTAHQQKIQGAVYMAAFYNEYGYEPEKVKFIHIKEGKVRSFEPSDEEWDYMLTHAQSLISAKSEGEFPSKPGEQCYWCPHEFFCPDSDVGVGNVPWEEY